MSLFILDNPISYIELPRDSVKATPHWPSVTTGGNRIARRKPAIRGGVKLDNTLPTCDQGNFNQITTRSRNRTLVTVVRDTCTTTVTPTPLPNRLIDTDYSCFSTLKITVTEVVESSVTNSLSTGYTNLGDLPSPTCHAQFLLYPSTKGN